MGRMSREKGKRGEREAAELLRSHGFPARRAQQYAGGVESADVIGLAGVHLEIKRTETLRLYPAVEQAMRDRKPGDLACVLHRQNSRPWLAVLPVEDFLSLYREATRQVQSNRVNRVEEPQ